MIIDHIKEENFIIYKDEPNAKGQLGILENKIVEIPNFIDANTAKNMIDYFEYKSEIWGPIAFYNSSGMGLHHNDEKLLDFHLPIDFFQNISKKFKESVELIFNRNVKPNTTHAQKWDVGGFAAPHSDNSDFDGTPNPFEINKYVGVLYLNDDYDGGELYFPDHDIKIRPSAYSFISFPGGVENIHGVSEITKGTRYTMVSFWDFEESDYLEEIKDEWEEEIKRIRKFQEEQREEWAKGNKFA